jgi:universal stress protein A
MFQHILVPVDYTEKNRNVLEMAINLARSEQGLVSVLHVIELVHATPVEEFEAFYAPFEDQAAQKMAELVAPYDQATVELEQKIIYGNRVQAILRFAQEQGVDLIIMNSHKIDWHEPAQGWGTISHKVSIMADCPVLLVK